MRSALVSAVVPSIRPASLTPHRVQRELQQLIDAGVPVLPVGTARKHPLRVVAKYPPRFKLELFGVRF